MWGFTRKPNLVMTAEETLKADLSNASPESKAMKVEWVRNLSYTEMDNVFEEIETHFQSVGIWDKTSSGQTRGKTIPAMISSIRMEWRSFDRSTITDSEALILYSILVDQLPSIAVFHKMKMFDVMQNGDSVSKKKWKSLDLASWSVYSALGDCEKQVTRLYGEQLLRNLDVSLEEPDELCDSAYLFYCVQEAIQGLRNRQRSVGPVALFTTEQRSFLEEVTNSLLPDLQRMVVAIEHSEIGSRQAELSALLKIVYAASAKLEAIMAEHAPEIVFSDSDMHSVPYIFPY